MYLILLTLCYFGIIIYYILFELLLYIVNYWVPGAIVECTVRKFRIWPIFLNPIRFTGSQHVRRPKNNRNREYF